MLAVLLLLAAAALLAVGYVGEEPDLVRIALGASVAAAVLVLAPRLVGTIRARRGAGADAADGEDPVEDAAVDAQEPEAATELETVTRRTDAVGEDVVFVPGRLTVHAATCAALGGKTTSSADRAQLEAGGMKPCRRCLG